MNNYIHITVAAIVENNGDFLMVEEHSSRLAQNVFNQPAGHVENNESIINAVVRETLEETAWLVEPKFVVGIYQSFNDKNQDATQYLRFCIACNAIEKTNNPLDPDIINSLWINPQDIMALDNTRSPMVKRCLQDYLDGQCFPLDILTTLR